MEPLTPRQQQVYEFIVGRLERTGRPPTMREVGAALGIASTNGVRCFFEVLETKGYITRDPGLARGIRIRQTKKVAPKPATIIPIVGQIAAGAPLLAEENIDDLVTVDSSLFPRREGTFALRVKGDSMINAGILEGDLVIVQPNPRPRNGDIAVAFWEGEATVKRFFRKDGSIVLRPENSSYRDIRIHPDQDDFRVLGTVVGLVRRVTAP